MSKIRIDVNNTTNHDIIMQKNTTLGSPQLVKSIAPVELNLAENTSEDIKQSVTGSISQATITRQQGTTMPESTSDGDFFLILTLLY